MLEAGVKAPEFSLQDKDEPEGFFREKSSCLFLS